MKSTVVESSCYFWDRTLSHFTSFCRGWWSEPHIFAFRQMTLNNFRVSGRNNFEKFREVFFPIFADSLCLGTVGVDYVVCQESFHQIDVAIVDKLVDADHCWIQTRPETFLFVENKDLATAHPGSKILAGSPEDHNHTGGHVFATVVSDAFNDCHGSRISNREPFTGHPVEIGFSACCSVQDHVTDDNIFRSDKRGISRSVYRDPAAREAFTDVIVCDTFQVETDPWCEKSTETLAG